MQKVFERIIYSQTDGFLQDKLPNLITGFRTKKDCVMYMLEVWKNMLDKGEHVCAMFIVLWKPFGTIHHDLMIDELGA